MKNNTIDELLIAFIIICSVLSIGLVGYALGLPSEYTMNEAEVVLQSTNINNVATEEYALSEEASEDFHTWYIESRFEVDRNNGL